MKTTGYFKSLFPGKWLCFLLGTSLLVGCADTLVEDGQSSSSAKALLIGGSIEQVNQTRVTEQGFADGDCMGVFVVDYKDADTPGTLEISDNRASNYALTYDDTSDKWSGNSTIYWKDETTPVDVYGYYPYTNGVSSVTAHPFTVEADQNRKAEGEMSAYEKSDFLWAKATKKVAAEGAITLTYKHKLAGVKVVLQEGENFGEGEWESLPRLVTVDNTTRNASIDLSTGTATATGDFDKLIVMSDEGDDTYRAIVIPQKVEADKSLIGVNIDGISYPLTKEREFTFTAGKLHTFTIIVNKCTETGTYELALADVAISHWETDNSSHNLTLNEYVVVHVEEPGTLESCLAANGCDLSQLKNLKVTGNLTDTDFRFIRESIPYLYALNLRETKMKNVATSEYEWDEDCELIDDMLPVKALYCKESLRTLILPESITRIGNSALYQTSLSNILVIPNSVKRIDESAFRYMEELNLEVVLPDSLVYIGPDAFLGSLFKCEFKMPNTVEYIGGSAFADARNFYGHFRLSDNLKSLTNREWGNQEGVYEQSSGAFYNMGTNMTGDIVIPPSITEIPGGTFCGIGFANGTTVTLHDGVTVIGDWAFGNLDINLPISFPSSLTTILTNAFAGCQLKGQLLLPDNLTFLGKGAFGNDGSIWGVPSTGLTGELTFPKNISVISNGAFSGQSFTSIVIPDNVTSINPFAFKGLEYVKSIKLGKNVDYIGSEAFANCSNLQTMVSLNPVPPTVSEKTFEGIYFDKAILEVPAEAVEVYRRTDIWNRFLNITEHKELACNIPSIECLHKGATREGVVRSEGTWSVIEKPDWCTVTPSQGGTDNKQEITVTVSSMQQGDGNRSGRIVFQLDGTNYETYIEVSQYDYTHAEDSKILLHEASVPGATPIPIFIVGEGFDASSIADGTYLELMRQQMEHFFNIEPYRTYREYFSVYTAVAVSPDEGIIMPGAVTSANRFNTYYDDYGFHTDETAVMEYMKSVTGWSNWENASILMLGNLKAFVSTTFRGYWSNKRITLCGISEDTYPYDQRGLVQHEFGGHNFADLGDEMVEHFEFLKACTCPGCQALGTFNEAKRHDGFANLSLTGSVNSVPWKHLIFDPRYSDIVDVYEGGHRHLRGVYRSEVKSCMGTYIPYYNTISRETIVKRIMKLAGREYNFEDFATNDKRDGIPTE